jgi:hypothetical protein
MNIQAIEIKYKNYPAMISFFKETDELGRKWAVRYCESVVNEYNRDLKEFTASICHKLHGGIHMSTGLIVRIIKSIRREYLKRVDSSVRLNKIEKYWLKNYIIARYREEVNPFIGQA